MGKFIIGATLSLVALSVDVAISDTGVACAAPGNCSYTSVPSNPGAVISGGSSVPVPTQLAQQFAECIKEKGDIDKEFATCDYNSTLDNSREVSRCSALNNTNTSWGGSAGYHVVFFNATYTVENATYDKCINQVSAGFTSARSYCGLKYVENKNTARSAMGGRCRHFYQ